MEQKYTLSMIPHAEQFLRGYDAPVVHVSQFDKGIRKLVFHLIDGAKPLVIEDDFIANIYGMKPDGNAFEYPMDVDIRTSTASVTVQEQMATVAGCVKCEIRLFKGSDTGETIGSANFIMLVEKAAVGDDASFSKSDMPIIATLLFEGEPGDVLVRDENGVKWDKSADADAAWGKIKGSIDDQEDLAEALDKKQNTLTAGDGITIENDVISASVTSLNWGSIKGNIDDQDDLREALDEKVTKEDGMGLSEENYTADEKAKLANLPADAQKNVQSDWTETDTASDAYILNKPSIPAKTSDLVNDDNFISKVDWGDIKGTLSSQKDLNDALALKQNAEAGKGLSEENYTAAEKTKLAGIQSEAEKNVQADWNETDNTSDAFIQNKPEIPSKTSDLTNDSGFITAALAPVQGVKGSAETEYRTGTVDITKANIGLGNVDNTSDADKPVSTAVQNVLNPKQGKLTAGSNISIDENNVISATGREGTGGHVVINATGSAMPQRGKIQFTNTTVTDDSAADITIVTGIKGDPGEKGDKGTGIASAVLNADYTLTLTFTDGTSFTTSTPIRGETGPQGPQGEQGIQGPIGPDGKTGNGIQSVTKTGTAGLVDTYTIAFTDGTSTTFTVTNGKDGSSDVQWGDITGDIANQTDLQTALNAKQDTLTFDNTPASASDNPVKSSGIYNAIQSVNNAIAAVDTRVTNVDTKADGIADDVTALDAKADGIASDVTDVDAKADANATKIDALSDSLAGAFETITATDWSNTMSTVDGVDYYTYTTDPLRTSGDAVLQEPIIGIAPAAGSTLPTQAEQLAYDSWTYAYYDTDGTITGSQYALRLYAKAKPVSDFRIKIKGV